MLGSHCSCDPALQFAPLIGDDIDSLSVDHFSAAWTGDRVRVDRAFMGVNALPSPSVQYVPTAQSSVSQQHHLHVTADRCELRFNATVVPENTGRDLYCLRFPSQLQLQELVIDGTSQPFRGIRYADYTEIPLNDLRDTESIQIQALAVLPLDDESQFVPPRISVAPASLVEDEYLISRDPSVAIHTTNPTLVEPIALAGDTAVDWLRRGWSPWMSLVTTLDEQVADSQANDDQQAQPSPLTKTFRVEAFPVTFSCQQLLSISQQNGQWMMAANIRFDSERMPDVIDIEAPADWCKSLEVEGALQWVRLVDQTSPRQILRIRYDKQSVSERALTIRGQFQGPSTDRVSVPLVQVLGPGRHQIYIDIPNRSASGDPILWQTVAVDSVPLPTPWNESEFSNNRNRSTFVVSGPAWSIEIAAAPEIDVAPTAYLFDGNVFSRSDGALIHCRWDLFPGSLDSVDLSIPDGTTVLASWCAGRAVQGYRIDGDQQQPAADDETFRIPLAVGQLPQSVEILLRVSAKAAKGGQYLPRLIDIPVARNWLVHHVPKYQSAQHELTQAALSFPSSPGRSLSAVADERQVDLAASILESVESVERTSGQSTQETKALVRDWLLRYQRVRAQGSLEDAAEPIQTKWKQLELQLAELFQRYGFDLETDATLNDGDSAVSIRSAASNFADSAISGFEIERITALSATTKAPAVQSSSATDRGLKTMIVNGLTIALVIGLLICLIPVYRFVAPVTAHPAFWLALMGIFGFAIAPIGVAGAMLLLAITLPVFPTKRRVSGRVR